MIFETMDQLRKGLDGVLEIRGDDVRALDENRLRQSLVDDLIYTAVFSPREEIRGAARWLIRRAGAGIGILSASIQPLYEAMGRKEVKGFTVPAINIRAFTYHTAQSVLRAAL